MPQVVIFWDCVRYAEGDGCWEWDGRRNSKGYGCYVYERRPWLAHRFAWEFTNGAIPAGLCVLHRCDNPPCVRPSHLFIGTQTENIRDMDRKGRRRPPAKERSWLYTHPESVRGSKNPNAKLTEEQVREIRHLRASGARRSGVAALYGVSESLIQQITSGKIWKDCPMREQFKRPKEAAK